MRLRARWTVLAHAPQKWYNRGAQGETMKKKLVSLFALVLVAGCLSKSPYEYLENWLIREDPVRMFAVPADVFYVQGDMYTKKSSVPMMTDYARMEVGHQRFHGIARVFSPLIASSDDLEAAIKWYFKYHHEGNRSFVFIGEGEGGRGVSARPQAAPGAY